MTNEVLSHRQFCRAIKLSWHIDVSFTYGIHRLRFPSVGSMVRLCPLSQLDELFQRERGHRLGGADARLTGGEQGAQGALLLWEVGDEQHIPGAHQSIGGLDLAAVRLQQAYLLLPSRLAEILEAF